MNPGMSDFQNGQNHYYRSAGSNVTSTLPTEKRLEVGSSKKPEFTLPETNMAPAMDSWKMNFLLGRPIFRGYVSFREGTSFISPFLRGVLNITFEGATRKMIVFFHPPGFLL